MFVNPEISIGAFVFTFLVLIAFLLIVAVRKWKLRSGKIFTFHLLTKIIWFLGIFLTGFSDYNMVLAGAVLFLIGGWGLGYTMLLFALHIMKDEKVNRKFFKYFTLASILYFISFLFIPPFKLLLQADGSYYFRLTNYFFVPAIILSTSYYLTIYIFFKMSFKSKKSMAFWYMLFSVGLLIHSIPAHTFVILEFLFGVRHIILNTEYFSMIGFAIALFAYVKGFKK